MTDEEQTTTDATPNPPDYEQVKQNLASIQTAKYGEEVRGAIHYVLKQCYADVEDSYNTITNLKNATANATKAANDANDAAKKANDVVGSIENGTLGDGIVELINSTARLSFEVTTKVLTITPSDWTAKQYKFAEGNTDESFMILVPTVSYAHLANSTYDARESYHGTIAAAKLQAMDLGANGSVLVCFGSVPTVNVMIHLMTLKQKLVSGTDTWTPTEEAAE